MTLDEILQALSDTRTQREKLAGITPHAEEIRALRDDMFATAIRTIHKKLNSPKIADQLKAFVASLSNSRISIPAPPPPVVEPERVPDPALPDELEARLEHEIAANPDSQDAYLAYGDYLASKGDPRGEMIGIGRELAKNPGHKEMKAAHKALEPQILGPLAECLDVVTGIDWYMGFIRGARVAYTSERFNGDGMPDVKIADVVTWLVDGPGRFLQHLTIGLVRQDDNNYGAIAAILAQRPRQLRTLHLGDFTYEDCELNWSNLDDLSGVWPMCQELREVTLRGGSMKVGAISLPRATSFTIVTGELDAASLGHVASAPWPELVDLNVQLGAHGTDELQLLEPLLAATNAPKLRSLGVTNSNSGDGVLRRVAESKLLRQLEVLDVSMSLVEEDGFAVLEQHRDRFAHLHKLVLCGADTAPRAIPGLNVVWGERYGPVYE